MNSNKNINLPYVVYCQRESLCSGLMFQFVCNALYVISTIQRITWVEERAWMCRHLSSLCYTHLQQHHDMCVTADFVQTNKQAWGLQGINKTNPILIIFIFTGSQTCPLCCDTEIINGSATCMAPHCIFFVLMLEFFYNTINPHLSCPRVQTVYLKVFSGLFQHL